VEDLKAANAPLAEVQAAERRSPSLPKDEAAAQDRVDGRPCRLPTAAPSRWPACPGMPQQYAGDPNGDAKAQKTFDESRRNFLALVFCLMVGTAALPHILMRYYTTPTVKEARQSVTWSLFFIFLLYFTAPALAVLVKYEVFTCAGGHALRPVAAVGRHLGEGRSRAAVGRRRQQGRHLPAGRDAHRRRHHRAGHAGDRRPAVRHRGMVAAGGLAAALSTADGLLLTIANALSHDLYYKMIDPNAPTARRVMISKACCWWWPWPRRYVAAQKVADILFLVSAAFSLAAAGFFPALVWASSGSAPASGARCWA
jgi:cation/acetate symporter